MRGNVDLVTQEGLVEGWCWDENAPTDRVTVSIRVDGEECGQAVACHYRKDLQDAGIGDGAHFFRLLLPDLVLRNRRNQNIALFDPTTGKAIGEPYTVRFEYSLRFDDRLSELEARSRLIESRLTELADASTQRTASAELFAIVGAFFQRLSDDLARGTTTTPELQLGAAIHATTRALPPITFPAAIDANVTVLIEADCPLVQLHRCLAALRQAAVGMGVRVVVLDPGRHDDTSLICSVAQGIQYRRLAGDLVSEWIQAGMRDASAIVILLSGDTVVEPAFLSELSDYIESNPHAGAAGGCSFDADGRLQRLGFRALEGQLISCTEAVDRSMVTTDLEAEPVQALSHVAAAFRRKAIEAVGGLDPIFGDELWAAVIDLCFRLRRQGWLISARPTATFSTTGSGSSTASHLATPSRARELLLHRWTTIADVDPASSAGFAVVLGQSDRAEEGMDAVQRLQEAGFGVQYVAAGEIKAEQAASLKRAGAQIVEVPDSFAHLPVRIIFAASSGDLVEQLQSKTGQGVQFVIGLPNLIRVLEHNKAIGLASSNA